MFCRNCGSKFPDGSTLCVSCGTRTATPQPAAPASRGEPKRNQRKKGMAALMLLAAVFLIFIGIGHMAIAVVGRTATAQVTGYEQKYIIQNDESTRNPSRYKLDYAFSVNGERYTGSVTRVFPGGSHMRQTLPVRYLPFWPHINAEDSGGMNPAGPVILGAGILLLVLEMKRKPRI